MALAFGASVAVNNILALKEFNTFIHNYRQYEHPSRWVQLKLLLAKRWIYKQAWKNFLDLRAEVSKSLPMVSLKDVDARLFAVLYLAKQPQGVHNGNQLFRAISESCLEFEKIKNPRANEAYSL